MQIQNYASSFLNCFNKNVDDEMGNPVFTIHSNSIPAQDRFIPSLITFDSLQEEVQMQTPVMKETDDMRVIESIGFVVVSVPCKVAWNSKRQQYHLVKKSDINLERLIVLKSLKKGGECHKVQIDEANLRARLIGNRAGKDGVGPWLEITK